MKLFFKHIFRSLRAHPLQPLLILLTVSLCISVSVTAVGLYNMFSERNETKENYSSLLGDIIIRVGSDSEERMLFSDDAERILEDDADVFGDYSLTAFMKNGDKKYVNVSAADILRADKYFKFNFTEYGRFTDENLENSAIVSSSFAAKNEIKLNDTLTLELLGESVSYNVQAIATDEVYFSECDILVDISGAVKLLAQKSPAIATLGESFAPSNRLVLRISDSNNVETVFDTLSSSAPFEDDYIELVDSLSSANLAQLFETVIIFLLAFLSIALSAIVTSTAMSFLSLQRSHEYALFEISGATRRQIAQLRRTEAVIYAVISSIIGLCISPAMLNGAASLFKWYNGQRHISFGEMLFGILFALILVIFCSEITARKNSKNALRSMLDDVGYTTECRRKDGKLLPIALTAVTSLCAFCVLLTPIPKQYTFAIAALVCEILLVYFATPFVFSATALASDKLLSHIRHLPTLSITFKNLKHSYSQKQICKLLAVLLSILLALLLCTNTVFQTEKEYKDAFDGSIIAIGLSDKITDELKGNESITGIAEFDFNGSAEIEDEYVVMTLGISADTYDCISSSILPQNPPQQGEIAISKGIAALCDLHEGDSASFSMQGHEYTLTVSEICNIKTNFVYVNQEEVDFAEDMYILSASDAHRPYIISELESQGVAVLDTDSLDIEVLQTLNGFLSLSVAALIAAVAIAVIGLCNMLSEQMHARKRERELLSLSGMTKRQTVKMYILEFIIIAVIAVLLALAFGFAIFYTASIATKSFGFTLI